MPLMLGSLRELATLLADTKAEPESRITAITSLLVAVCRRFPNAAALVQAEEINEVFEWRMVLYVTDAGLIVRAEADQAAPKTGIQ